MNIQEHCSSHGKKIAKTGRNLSAKKTGRPNMLNRRDKIMIVRVALCNSELTDTQENEGLIMWFQSINYALYSRK